MSILSYQSLAKTSALHIIRDSEIETILKDWSRPIFKAAGIDPEAVNIILVQNDAVNAFVAGGQNIFIYTGLIFKTENPVELIGVIAHETGHISGGHLIQSRIAMEHASYESIIGTILGIGSAIVSKNPSSLSALTLGGGTFAQRHYLAHSRIQESSADQAALSYMNKAKINPTGLVTFMDKLKGDMYVLQNQQSEYVQTHPLMDNRIDVLKRRIEQSPYKTKPYPKIWDEQYMRMKAKLLSFIHPEQVIWVYSDRDLSIPAQYARTIASYRNNDLDDAIKQINNLLLIEPNNPYFLELKGQILVDFGHVKQALIYYRKALDILPRDSLLHISFAHALIESITENNPQILNEAIRNLELALQDEPRSARIHRLLAIAYGRLGQENRAKLHLAEEAVLQKRYVYATEHVNAILSHEQKGSPLWLKANDILSFIQVVKAK